MSDRQRGASEPLIFTRRQYLIAKAMMAGSGTFLAVEAVATTLLEHPELDPEETKTWVEWEES